MARERARRGLVLPAGHTGSSLFHSVLSAARDRFPSVFEGAALPRDPGTFKRDYGTFLARFEAARAASAERVEIARFILQRAQASLRFVDRGAEVPLAEYLAGTARSVAFDETDLGQDPRFRLRVPFEGRAYEGREVHRVIDRLAEAHQITEAARVALGAMVDRIASEGTLDLRGHRFALLGAGAELAPTRLLLASGARVLWVDVADRGKWLRRVEGTSGTLVAPAAAGDLLEDPAGVVAALRLFAKEDGPMHVGMFAYASGASQEWRLCAAMHAIVARLSQGDVRSVSLLVSPTSTVSVQPECLDAARRQAANPPRWKAALNRAGLLPTPAHHSVGSVHVSRATVSIQGLSYQAAQYITKLLAAEAYAAHGVHLDAPKPHPITVSANVAGITNTRSLAHPLFQAAFIGAPRFGVRIFEPETTRVLSGLLMVHDLLHRRPAPGSSPGRELADLFSRQVHGGIYSMPYVLEPAIRVAALIGMSKKPGLLFGRSASVSAPAAS